jgi:hypothetical protein
MLVPPSNGGGTSSSGSSIQPAAAARQQHRRQSSLNTVSWPNQNELTVTQQRQCRLSISPQAVATSGDVTFLFVSTFCEKIFS